MPFVTVNILTIHTKMKKLITTGLFLMAFLAGKAQKVENIYINLYTDSLKKGTHNYINVDAKMTDGSWRPLTSKDIKFESDYGKFDGNDLVLPEEPTVKKVTVAVTLKENPQKTEKITIAIKQKPDPKLPAYDADAEMRSGRARR